MTHWNPIATAPKYMHVLVYASGRVEKAWQGSYGWKMSNTHTGWIEPTHWQALPAPPTTQQESGE